MAAQTPILEKVQGTSSELMSRFHDVLPDLANNAGRATTAGLRFLILVPAVILVGLAAFLLAAEKTLTQKQIEDEIASIRAGVERVEAEIGGAQ